MTSGLANLMLNGQNNERVAVARNSYHSPLSNRSPSSQVLQDGARDQDTVSEDFRKAEGKACEQGAHEATSHPHPFTPR